MFEFAAMLAGAAVSMGGTAFADAPDCSRTAGSLPDPSRPAGTPDFANPIEHVVISMQENHSFDEYLGRLNDPAFYGKDVDGTLASLFNPDRSGNAVHAFHETSRCVVDTNHTWEAEHTAWDNGKNDGFVRANGTRVMGYYESTDLPYYYALANQFAVADRYFCSAITQTFPNRFFLYTGTAFGHIRNDVPVDIHGFPQKTILDTLDQYKISWRYYTDGVPYLKLFQPLYRRDKANIRPLADYDKDLKAGTLPQVVLIESKEDIEDEHPPADSGRGEAWVSSRIGSLMASSAWKNSAYFLVYDENGAFYDHVSPPAACAPEADPASGPQFNNYGFRVPFIAVSPYAKHHYVSHEVYDHTSILKFIEKKFNLPALTNRDANALGLDDLFDFKSSPKLEVTALPQGFYDPRSVCHPHGG
jgi:phospholipase C